MAKFIMNLLHVFSIKKTFPFFKVFTEITKERTISGLIKFRLIAPRIPRGLTYSLRKLIYLIWKFILGSCLHYNHQLIFCKSIYTRMNLMKLEVVFHPKIRFCLVKKEAYFRIILEIYHDSFWRTAFYLVK